MSRQINQPINQVRLTNVAVVRMNKGGQRFEIACYKNKVVDYRQGLEADLSEVLQTDRVFTNVSKGEFAKAKDLQKVFGTKDDETIAKLILTKGQVQVSDKERSQQQQQTTAQIAEWISKNCVHPQTNRPYTISQIKHAMTKANFSVHPTKPLKRQYLDCVKLLQQVLPLQRAKMELRLVLPRKEILQQEINQVLTEQDVTWQEQPLSSEDNLVKYVVQVDPSLYRVLNDVLQQNTADGSAEAARMEIINPVVMTQQGDYTLEEEQHEEGFNATDHLSQATQPLTVNDIKVNVDGQENADDSNNSSSDVSSDDDNQAASAKSRRKAQKKAQKKNQKAKRRTTEDNHENDGHNGELQMITESGNTMTSTSNDMTRTDTSSAAPNDPPPAADNHAGRKTCNTCGGFFDTPADFRAHFKSDWHRFNQQLKLKGAAPISEKEFMLCDSDSFFSSGKGNDLLL